jgi:hypothetical protein
MAVKKLLLISKPLKNLHKVFKNRVIATKVQGVVVRVKA